LNILVVLHLIFAIGRVMLQRFYFLTQDSS